MPHSIQPTIRLLSEQLQVTIQSSLPAEQPTLRCRLPKNSKAYLTGLIEMLRTLYIENIAVIEKTSIDFENGLNVLTGETGAGKSI